MNMLFTKLLSFIYRKLRYAYDLNIEESIKSDPRIKFGDNVRILSGASVSLCKNSMVTFGDNTWFAGKINTFPHNQACSVDIGKDCYIGDMSRIWAAKRIEIGDRTLIAHNVNIFDTTTHPTDKKIRYEHECIVKCNGMPSEKFQTIEDADVIIGDDVWIGCNSIILKGVKIGSGSIVAAGSIVTKSIPPNTMVAGNPARVVKKVEETV